MAEKKSMAITKIVKTENILQLKPCGRIRENNKWSEELQLTLWKHFNMKLFSYYFKCGNIHQAPYLPDFISTQQNLFPKINSRSVIITPDKRYFFSKNSKKNSYTIISDI